QQEDNLADMVGVAKEDVPTEFLTPGLVLPLQQDEVQPSRNSSDFFPELGLNPISRHVQSPSTKTPSPSEEGGVTDSSRQYLDAFTILYLPTRWPTLAFTGLNRAFAILTWSSQPSKGLSTSTQKNTLMCRCSSRRYSRPVWAEVD